MSRSLKVVIIGDGSAGKTSLRSRYLHNSFQKAYISTIGADFISKTIEVEVPIPVYETRNKKTLKDLNGQLGVEVTLASSSQSPSPTSPPSRKFRQEKVRITLSIWDTAGQERFKSLGSAFYRGSDAVIVAFDLIAKGSLARTINWYNDFCRLGDIGYEKEGMSSRQLKRAREQKERFCWVGVGCKGDLLQALSERGENVSEEEEQWKGTSWTEARGWYDTMIPRYLPDGEQEIEGYLQVPNEIEGQTSLPYTFGAEVPARPQDVLSRPNKTSTSSQPAASSITASEINDHLGRPTEAGAKPGTAATPGSKFINQSSRKSHGRSASKAAGSIEKRKSIRSIDIWQGNSSPHPIPADSLKSESLSTATRDEYHRSRYDSATSAGGAPSIYYSVRGSTVFGQSPAGGSTASADVSTTSLPHSAATTTRAGQEHKRDFSLSSQARPRKQSNLSEVLTEDDGDINDLKTGTVRTNGSSGTIMRKDKRRGSDASVKVDDAVERSVASIPTIPSGDPIPFPSGDDLEEEEEQPETPVRRRSKWKGTSSKETPTKSTPTKHSNDQSEEGEIGRKTRALAEATQDHRAQASEEQENGTAEETQFDRRATLYSARPSSISSTIKAADEIKESDEEDDGTVEDQSDPCVAYREQIIEQGFRLFYTSAKDGQGIDQVFEHIARRVAMRWKLEEWEERQSVERSGGLKPGQVRTAPPTDEEMERERMKRAIKLSSGKGTGNCCY